LKRVNSTTPTAVIPKQARKAVALMFSPEKQEWIDNRIKERKENLKGAFWELADPTVPVLDAGTFAQPLADVTRIVTNAVEREGPKAFLHPTISIDVSIILRHLRETYNLISWVNADDFRFGVLGYRTPYSFVILPVVRTMIDGFYNATAMLDDPSRARNFRISGYYRKREALQADEARYGTNPLWQADFSHRRKALADGMRADQFTKADLDDKNNKWPLLSVYLKSNPDTPHKRLLRHLTLGFWKEYSAISHSSFDALVDLFPFIATDLVPHEHRDKVQTNALRLITMHIGRAGGLLLCLLTELQHFFKFNDFEIDRRLRQVWTAMVPLYEVRELYDFRYNSILREPEPTDRNSGS
jgi:hypothetical protein